MKLKKWPFLDQNHGLTPLGKCQFFDFWTSCFYRLEKRFFVLKYHKRHFPGLYFLKKKSEKIAIFGAKPRVNPFGKMSIFFYFLNFFFSSFRKAFFVLEYHKRHFSGLYCLQKKLKKWPFLDQSHGLTPFNKCQLFEFLNFLFL